MNLDNLKHEPKCYVFVLCPDTNHVSTSRKQHTKTQQLFHISLINNYDYMKWEEVNKAAHNQKKISGVWYSKRKPIVHKELP